MKNKIKKIIGKVLYFTVFANVFFFITILMNMAYERCQIFKDICKIGLYEIAYPGVTGHHYMVMNIGSVISVMFIFVIMYVMNKVKKFIIKKISK